MIEIQIEGSRVKVMVMGDQIWFHWQGQSYSIPTLASLKTKTRRGKNSSAADSGKIVAPMPGKITQLRSHVGAPVSVGQVVLVMEAMKMEYTLKSARDGVLKAIFCAVGQNVTADMVLAEVEKIGPKSATETPSTKE